MLKANDKAAPGSDLARDCQREGFLAGGLSVAAALAVSYYSSVGTMDSVFGAASGSATTALNAVCGLLAALGFFCWAAGWALGARRKQ